MGDRLVLKKPDVTLWKGEFIVAIGYHNRKLRRHYDNPVIELFSRF